MKAVILCAGKGLRMKPYTTKFQKAMLPINGKPLLEYIIRGLKLAGIKEFVLVIGYKKEQVVKYFGDGTKFEIDIEYVEQEKLNGTGGALLICEPLIKEDHFLLTWGDTLISYGVYKSLLNVFKKEKNDFILVANPVKDPYLGAAIYLQGDYCIDIIEKPPKDTSKSRYNNSGIFILHAKIFDLLKKQQESPRGEIELTDALRMGIRKLNWKIRVIKMQEGDFYGDFGNKEDYERLKSDLSWLNSLNER
ncbi:MAG: nucleotidyltransferase family protein [Promethearchaeota archaeon]